MKTDQKGSNIVLLIHNAPVIDTKEIEDFLLNSFRGREQLGPREEREVIGLGMVLVTH